MPSPVLVLPGLLEDADAFEPQLASLREVTTCEVADLTRGDSIGKLAEDALAQAPQGPLAVAGHSMGGYVALEMVRRWPARVERLALLNTHARPDSAESTENRRRLMALAERDFPGVIQALTPKLLAPAHQGDPGMTGTLSEMALGAGKEAFLRQERAIIGRIDSRPGTGTRVAVWLAAGDPGALAAGAGSGAAPTSGRGETVLVVDDEADIRGTLAALLDVHGYHVATANGATDALAEIERAPPDLLLLDYAMPGMSGLELALKVRERHPRLPIVFISGHAERGVLQSAIPGARLLMKPFDNDELCALIRSSLDGDADRDVTAP